MSPNPDARGIITPDLARRRLLRGGAMLAGAAGATLVGAVVSAPKAQAAAGDPLKLETANTAAATTSLEITGTSAALRLVNATGPALAVPGSTENSDLELQPGEIAGDPLGLQIGTSDGTTYLATGFDLELLPVTVAIDPVRVLDTRTTAGRSNIIVYSKAGAINAKGQLVGGAYIDIEVGPVDGDTIVDSVFVNVTVTNTAGAGFVTVFPPPDDNAKPTTSTINFVAGSTVANGAFVATVVEKEQYAIRVYATQTTSVVLDLTGGVLRPNVSATATASNARRSGAAQRARQARQARLVRKPFGRRLGR